MTNCKKNTRINLLFLMAVLWVFSVQAQVSDASQYIQNHDYTPEASSFKFGSNAVDYYTGKLNTAIPIHTYKGRELDLPMSLSYSSDGVQVEELANTTGLGWSLDFGGRISTILNGGADYIYNQGYRYERDIYTLQLPGVTEYFKMEYHNPMSQINPAIGAEMRFSESDNWIVHLPDGSTYFFENAKETNTSYDRNISGQLFPHYSFVSSWLLTKIISKNGLDVYKFDYSDLTWANPIPNYGDGYRDGVYGLHPTGSTYLSNQRSPTAVYHNDEKIISFTYGPRTDLVFAGSTGNALQSINFHNYKGSADNTTTTSDDPALYKKAVFTYSYFGPTTQNYLEKRLKLDDLTFYGVDASNSSGLAGDKYHFDYNLPELLPAITSLAQDYLGLYNGYDNNATLVDNWGSFVTPYRRAYNFAKSQYGILNKITYPTKGYTVYEYEQNRLDDQYEYYYKGDSYRTDQFDVAFINYNINYNPSVGGAWAFCSVQDTTPHPSMAGTVNFQDYDPFDSNTSGQLNNVATTLLTVTSADTFYLDTPGEAKGIYLIQSLEGFSCDSPNASCGGNQWFNGPPTYCMRAPNTISYTGLSPNPPGFIKGGLIHTYYGSEKSVFLEPGQYQITLWTYSTILTQPPLGCMRVYKHIQTFVPQHLVSTNIAGTLTDGFRIKSITNYTGTGTAAETFASKKDFKYHKGKLFHNYNINYDGAKISSQGYLYNSVVFYESVTERNTNLDGNVFNGATQYIYGNADDTAGEQGIYLTVADKGIEKYYDPAYGGASEVMINKIHNSDLKEKKIYGNDGVLRYSEKHHYGFSEYATKYYHWGHGSREDEPAEESTWEPKVGLFPVTLSTTITNYPELDKGISTTTNYLYNEFSEVPSLPNEKEVVKDTGTEYYTFYNYFVQAYTYTYGTIIGAGYEAPNYSVFYGDFLEDWNTTPSLFKSIYTSNKGQMDFDYDTAKNRVTTTRFTPGAITPASIESIVWGYSNKFPVANIKGVKYSDIIASNATLITEIKALSQNEVSDANETLLKAKLQQLREAYPNKPVTTFTYNPVFGMTSMTDPKGQTSIYTYDIFGRSLAAKKQDPANGEQFYISEKEYNTRSN